MLNFNRFARLIMWGVMLVAVLPAQGQTAVDEQLILTAEETEWLNSHKNISVAVNPDWAPVGFFIKKENQFSGMAIDYLKLLENKLPITLNFVLAAEEAQRNQADILSAIANPKTLTQSQYQVIAEPYLQMPLVIFVRKDTDDVNNLSDLAGRKVAVFKSGVAARIIEKEHPDIDLVDVNLADDALLLLIEGKVDAYIGNLSVISYVANNLGIGELKIAAKTPYGAEVYLAIDKKYPLLKSIFEKGLATLTEADRNRIHSKWVRVTYEHHTDYRTLLIIMAVASGVILVISLWGWQLNREVKRRKAIESELVIAKERAESANNAKSVFLTSMSHELRTPLNAILGFGQLLETSHELSRVDKESVQEIVHAGNHLLALINGLLDLSKIESGKLGLEMTTVNLQQLIEQAVVTVSTLAAERDITVTKNIAESLHVNADQTRLKQVLLNLLSNAIKYNCDSGQVEVSSIRAGDKVVISVSDTGQGIAKKDLKEVFEPFQRLEAEMSSVEGTGIGLSITKHIINEMGGKIEVESKLGQGSTFRVILPLLTPLSGSADHH